MLCIDFTYLIYVANGYIVNFYLELPGGSSTASKNMCCPSTYGKLRSIDSKEMIY